jgi:epoxyqueuosine reductase
MLIDKIKLKELGKSIGIDQLGISSASPLKEMRARLERRTLEDRVTPFEEKNPELRLSPEHLLTGCRSIITLAVPYSAANQKSGSAGKAPRGSVARCARAIDYHLVARKKAAELINSIKITTGKNFNFRILSDRSPLLEREIARRSGLGIIGENCTLINPVYGSYVALCTILLDVLIEPDLPFESPCLKCGRCREACPTGALTESYIINPYRCLSYLTQVKGIIPREFRAFLGNRIYGCDLCQEVCPLNNRVAGSPLPEFSFELFPAEPLLLPLLAITRHEFDLTIKLTAAGWRGKTTLQRNTVIALGNSAAPNAVSPLARLLECDSRPLIRLHAAWALGRLSNPLTRRVLSKAAAKDPDEKVRLEALLSLTSNE